MGKENLLSKFPPPVSLMMSSFNQMAIVNSSPQLHELDWILQVSSWTEPYLDRTVEAKWLIT